MAKLMKVCKICIRHKSIMSLNLGTQNILTAIPIKLLKTIIFLLKYSFEIGDIFETIKQNIQSI